MSTTEASPHKTRTEPYIQTLFIQGYRLFGDVTIGPFGNVTLITGKNNSGKSTLLEALLLLASNTNPDVIMAILALREELPAHQGREGIRRETVGSILSSSLFHHSALQLDIAEEMQIKAAHGSPILTELCITVNRSNGAVRVSKQAPHLRELSPLSIDITDGLLASYQKLQDLPPERMLCKHAKEGQELFNNLKFIPHHYVSPQSGQSTRELAHHWDKIALTDREDDVVNALKIIDPSIKAISFVGTGQGTRSAMVRTTRFPTPVPLRSFGDGMNRLLSIVLAMSNARDGIVLIDEFENGMHYSAQLDAWRVIFKMAKDLNIQVVATSHSWDAIEAFQKAASETPQDGVLIRLTKRDEGIIPTVINEEELAIATREHIEVR